MSKTYLPQILESVRRLRHQVCESQLDLVRAADQAILPAVLWRLVFEYACQGLFETSVEIQAVPQHVLAAGDGHWWLATYARADEKDVIQIESTHFQGPVFVEADVIESISELSGGSLLVLGAVYYEPLLCFSVSPLGQVAKLWEYDCNFGRPQSSPCATVLISGNLAPGTSACCKIGDSYAGNFVLLDAVSGAQLRRWRTSQERACEAYTVGGDLVVEDRVPERRVVVLSSSSGQTLADWPYPWEGELVLLGLEPRALTARFASQDEITTCELLTGRVLHVLARRGTIKQFERTEWSNFSQSDHIYHLAVDPTGEWPSLYLLL